MLSHIAKKINARRQGRVKIIFFGLILGEKIGLFYR